MIFWFFIITLTASAVLAVLLPVARRPARLSDGQRHDREVYVDQLAELEREKADGRIAPEEAEAARAEIARRLLAGDTQAERAAGSGDSPFRRRFAALVALTVLPVLAIATYSLLGSPNLPSMPLQARLTAPQSGQDVMVMVAQVEKHLAENPEDGQGWEVLGPVYMRLERPREAAIAFRNAVRLLGSAAEREANLGEALVAIENGMVTREARQAFERSVRHDPAGVKARFYLAIASEQEGKREEAAVAFRQLLADAPPNAPWRPFAEQALARVGGTPQPGPTREQVEAAGEMSEADRRQMIEGMVAGLAEKLEQDPSNPEGWVRLVRAYMVLERHDEALEAAGKALKSLEDPEVRKTVRAAFETMGLTLNQTEIQ